MKSKNLSFVIGIYSVALFSGCVNETLIKGTSLLKSRDAVSEVPVVVADSKIEEKKIEEEKADEKEPNTEVFLKFDGEKISVIPVFLSGGSFKFSVRDELASGALVSSDDAVQISDLETDLDGLSCEKLIDEKDLFYGVHCSYEALKGSVGDIRKIRLHVMNAGGAESDDYAYFEFKEGDAKSPYLNFDEEKVATLLVDREKASFDFDPASLIAQGSLESSEGKAFYAGAFDTDLPIVGCEKITDDTGSLVSLIRCELSQDALKDGQIYKFTMKVSHSDGELSADTWGYLEIVSSEGK